MGANLRAAAVVFGLWLIAGTIGDIPGWTLTLALAASAASMLGAVWWESLRQQPSTAEQWQAVEPPAADPGYRRR